MIPVMAFSLGKNKVANIGVRNANKEKSYHSKMVPKDEAEMIRIDVRVLVFMVGNYKHNLGFITYKYG